MGNAYKAEMPKFIYEFVNKQKHYTYIRLIKNIPIILNNDIPDKLYAMQDKYTYDKYLDWRNSDYSIPEWMITLGMIKKTAYYFYTYQRTNRP